MRRLGFILLLCCAGLLADIGDFYFYNQKHYNGLVIGRTPVLTVEVSYNFNILSRNDFVLKIDDIEVPSDNYQYNDVAGIFRYVFNTPLELGERKIQLTVFYSGGVEIKEVTVNVQQEKNLRGDLVLFPSPATANINVCYELGSAQSVSFLIYDLGGQLVCRRDFISGLPGGQSGYNQVTINLDAYSKRPLSNGAYIAVLMRSGSRTVLAKEKFLILR